VPCYGRPRQTRDLLRSLRAAKTQCEIIVVDDASPTPLAEVVDQFTDLDIKYLRRSENLGAASARNYGAAQSKHEFLAFTDNDCMVDPRWVDHFYASIAQSPPSIAAVGGRVVAHGRDIYSQYYDYHKVLDPWYYRGKHYYITTANAIFRRAAFDLVGGFDEAVRGAGGEDPGLCFKLQNAGFGLGYNPDAIVFHQYTPSFAAFMRMFYRYGYGGAGQSTKHYRGHESVQNTSFGGMNIEDEE
jgi:GT2 family glycosyltransferase